MLSPSLIYPITYHYGLIFLMLPEYLHLKSGTREIAKSSVCRKMLSITLLRNFYQNNDNIPSSGNFNVYFVNASHVVCLRLFIYVFLSFYLTYSITYVMIKRIKKDYYYYWYYESEIVHFSIIWVSCYGCHCLNTTRHKSIYLTFSKQITMNFYNQIGYLSYYKNSTDWDIENIKKYVRFVWKC